MFLTTFNQLQLSTDQLRPYTGCLYGVAGDQVEVRGHIELRTTFTDGASSRTTNISFKQVGSSSLHEAHEDEIVFPWGCSDHHQI